MCSCLTWEEKQFKNSFTAASFTTRKKSKSTPHDVVIARFDHYVKLFSKAGDIRGSLQSSHEHNSRQRQLMFS